MNCPGFSGEQSPKRMSRELEGRDPCRRESTSRGSQPTSAHAEFVRSKKTVPIAPATVRPTPRSWRSLDAPASRFANSASRRSATAGERSGRSRTDNARIKELEREAKGLRTAKPEQS